MRLTEIFSDELSTSETNYFILDSGQHENDVDFETYEWTRSINNKLSPNDLFIYRKPSKMSPKKEFMFFGVGKIGEISGTDKVISQINKPHPFKNPIFQSEINSYQWKWKERKSQGWEHFWNQYGINQIPKDDFIHILQMAEDDYDSAFDLQSISEDVQIAKQDFSVEDSQALATSRPWQSAWSRRVKEAYGYQCVFCGLSMSEFLVGSHIIPVRDKEFKSVRKDPSNGLCLCSMHDKAFDNGYVTLTNELTIKVSQCVKQDDVLWKYLSPIDGMHIKKPIRFDPKREYLEYHQSKIFLG